MKTMMRCLVMKIHFTRINRMLQICLLMLFIQQYSLCQLVDLFPLKEGWDATYLYSSREGSYNGNYSCDKIKYGYINHQVVLKTILSDHIEWRITEKESSIVYYTTSYPGDKDTTYTWIEEKFVILLEFINSQNHLLKGTSKIWSFDDETNMTRYDTLKSDTGNVVGFIIDDSRTTHSKKYYLKSNVGLISSKSSIFTLLSDFGATWLNIDASLMSSNLLNIYSRTTQRPNKYQLSQNYPNPFNSSTTITFSIPERSIVRLSIFNTLGQKISEIVNETKDVGSYEQSFNASQLSSGIYFYRIEATSTQNSGKTFVETMKMVLLR
ncbi:MAG: T9SS type A sorting domain-containing protein [Bacteroidota bacterium]